MQQHSSPAISTQRREGRRDTECFCHTVVFIRVHPCASVVKLYS
jgi:hypothetical protein